MQFTKVSIRKNAYHVLSVLALAGIVAAGCSSSSDSTSDTGTSPSGTGSTSTASSFTVSTSADRKEINLGNNPKGTIHFEAKGFYDTFVPQGTEPDPEYIYFYIWNGSNFYYKGAGEGFLYIPFEYAYTDYWCNYGKVKGRYNQPEVWPGEHGQEECYVGQDQPWDSEHWYSFDITMDGENISLTIDGELRNTWNYGGVSETLLAGFGMPPTGGNSQTTNTGMVGMQFRNISFTKR